MAALDGDRVVAQIDVDLQIIDDPAEFHDPRPDHASLLNLAKDTGGRAIQSSRPTWPTCWPVTPTRPFAGSSPAGRSGTIPCSGCCSWDFYLLNGSCAGAEGLREQSRRLRRAKLAYTFVHTNCRLA